MGVQSSDVDVVLHQSQGYSLISRLFDLGAQETRVAKLNTDPRQMN